jgi:hypothetical protein
LVKSLRDFINASTKAIENLSIVIDEPQPPPGPRPAITPMQATFPRRC